MFQVNFCSNLQFFYFFNYPFFPYCNLTHFHLLLQNPFFPDCRTIMPSSTTSFKLSACFFIFSPLITDVFLTSALYDTLSYFYFLSFTLSLDFFFLNISALNSLVLVFQAVPRMATQRNLCPPLLFFILPPLYQWPI